MSVTASRPVLVLGAIFAALPFVILFAPNYLEFFLVGGLLATPRLEVWRNSYRILEFSPITRAVVLLLIWALATTLWASVSRTDRLVELAALSALGLHLLFAIGNLSEKERRVISAAAVTSFVLATVVFLLIVALGFLFPVGLNWNPFDVRQSNFGAQIAAAYAALCWPLIGLIVTARIKVVPLLGQLLAAICLVGLTVGFFRLSSLAGLISVAVGGTALLFVSWQARTGVAVISGFALCYLFLAPTIHVWPPAVNESRVTWTQPITQELVAWHATAEEIFIKPIFGYGFQAHVPLQAEQVENQDLVTAPNLSSPPNLFLLIWLELGLVGGICFAAVIFAVGLSILRVSRGPLQAALLSASALSILAPAVLGAGGWELFWVASSWFVGGACLLLTGAMPIENRRAVSSTPRL